MAKRKGSSAPSRSRARKKAAEEGSDAREAENAQCLDKLPQEVWRKIPANLENNDLFPLALSCRYFRQKQKELVERAIERRIERVEPGWGSWKGWNRRIRVYRPALKTTLLKGKRKETLPASAEYIKFCMKEEEFLKPESRHYLQCLASLHGHLPLLQELLNSSGMIDPFITMTAAFGGQLETLQWLRSEGCPWDEDTYASAAKGGQLEILKWLRSEGCPWDADACTEVKQRGLVTLRH